MEQEVDGGEKARSSRPPPQPFPFIPARVCSISTDVCVSHVGKDVTSVTFRLQKVFGCGFHRNEMELADLA